MLSANELVPMGGNEFHFFILFLLSRNRERAMNRTALCIASRIRGTQDMTKNRRWVSSALLRKCPWDWVRQAYPIGYTHFHIVLFSLPQPSEKKSVASQSAEGKE